MNASVQGQTECNSLDCCLAGQGLQVVLQCLSQIEHVFLLEDSLQTWSLVPERQTTRLNEKQI